MRQTVPRFPEAAWRKSSYSGTQTECVEVAHAPVAVVVRDTKQRDGGTLLIPVAAWRVFTERL